MEKYSLLSEITTQRSDLERGFWYKIEVSSADITEERPLGICYSMTLHDKYNKRIFGIDNAHSVNVKKNRIRTGVKTFDHIHDGNKIYPRYFASEEELVEYFYNTIKRVVSEYLE